MLTTLPITGLYPLFYIEYDCCDLGDTKHDTKEDIGASGIDWNQVKGPNDLVGTREPIEFACFCDDTRKTNEKKQYWVKN